VLFVVILIAVVLVCGAILGAQALGYKPMAILSGSMEPNYNVNGLVFIDTNARAEAIGVGDVVAFDVGGGTTVTHRVVEVDGEARTFTTKGDANDTIDGATSWDALIGVATLHVPNLGGLAMGIRSTKGIAVGLIALAVLVLLFVIPIMLAPPKLSEGEREVAA
jgi:signal peptidase